ncbi:MAG: hypothetical protein JZU53_06985 [Paludibacter sp.]|nr:hypothetical protein [Paludibacter sp.]
MNCKTAIKFKNVIKKIIDALTIKIWNFKVRTADKLLNGTGMYITDVNGLIQFAKSVVSHIAPNSGLDVEEKKRLHQFFVDFLASYKVTKAQQVELESYLRIRLSMSEKSISEKFKQQLEEYLEKVVITHTVKQRYKLGN